MKEIPVSFKNGKYKVYGVLTLPGRKSKSAIVMSHGFNDHMNSHQIFNCSRKLSENGFAVLRMDFYGWRKNQKKLKDETVAKEISDLKVAIKFLKSRRYDSIGVVGHSMAGMASLMMQSEKNIADVMVVWEPSNRLNRFLKKDELVVRNRSGITTLDVGTEFVINGKLIDEWKEIGDISEHVKSITSPVMIISAEKGVLLEDAKKFYKSLKGPKSLKVISNADHNFDSYKTEDQLIHHTVEWFNKWLK